MDLIYWAIIGIGLFVAIWFLFVVPAERRHHERKLEMIQKKLEKRQAQAEENGGSAMSDDDRGET
jgi:hypothetical protein